MSQHDFDIANQGFPAFRSDMNLALVALGENSSGATEPSTTFAYQWWADTTATLLKMRNAANNAWITIGTLDQTNLALQPDVITTRGDVIRGSSAAIAERLAVGTNGQSLITDGTDVTWGGPGVLETEQATTSGTSIDFTSIPSWVKKINIMLAGVSTTGTSNIILQIGDAGGIETSGYLGSVCNLADTAGAAVISITASFGLTQAHSAATEWHGALTLTLEDSVNNVWAIAGGLSNTSVVVTVTSGSKPLSATLDRVRLTTVGGSETFDAGAINIMYK